MHDPANGLLRKHIPRTPVNRGSWSRLSTAGVWLQGRLGGAVFLRAFIPFSLASPGYGPHGFVNVLAILFDRFHVQMRPDEAVLFHPHDGYPGHVQPTGHPMPLAPHYTIGSRVPKQLCLEVREALEHGRLVLADLFFATEVPIGVGCSLR